MFSIGIQEIIVIVVVILIFIDYRKIPEFTKGMGKIYREIKSAQDNIKNEILRSTSYDKIGEQQKDLIKGADKSNEWQDDGSNNGSGRAG